MKINLKNTSKEKIRIFSLGGQDEKGKCMYVIEIKDNIFIFDAGFKFPSQEMLGIDIIFADIKHLIENKERIRALFISEATNNYLGSVSFLLRKINIPIYCSKECYIILNNKFRIFKNNSKKYEVNIISDGSTFVVNGIKISSFATQSSFPGSLGYAIHSKDGYIIYLSNYIFSGTNFNFPKTNISYLAKLVSSDDCLLLMSNVIGINKSAFVSPNHLITKTIKSFFQKSENKIYFICYEENFYYLHEMVLLTIEHNFKICFVNKNVSYLTIIKEFDKKLYNKLKLITLDEINEERVIIVITGNNKNLLSIVDNFLKFKNIHSQKDAFVINTTFPVNGYELIHAHIIDKLSKISNKFVSIDNFNLVKEYSSLEDFSLMLNLLKPKYFLPIQSLYKDFIKAKNFINLKQLPIKKTLIINNGDLLEWDGNDFKIKLREVYTQDIFVDGVVVDDFKDNIFYERQQLMRSGVFILVLSVSKKLRKIIDNVKVRMYGIAVKNDLIFKKKVVNFVVKLTNMFFKKQTDKKLEIQELKILLRKKLPTFFKIEYGKLPILLPVVFNVS